MPHPIRRAAWLIGTTFGALLLGLPPAAMADHQSGARGILEGPFALHSGSKCLDVNEPQIRVNGARVHTMNCDGSGSQAWRYERGRIVNVSTGRCLDVHTPDIGTNGARIQVWDCHGKDNQIWRFDGPQLITQADGRCLDVHGPDFDRNDGHVQTWSCHGKDNQQWSVEPMRAAQPVPMPAAARDVEAGPLWNNADADRKCPAVCSPGKWNGQWRTTIQGRMSVCGCVGEAAPWPHGSANNDEPERANTAGPRPMSDRRFDDLLQAMKAEGFPSSKLSVLEAAARDNYFVIAQVKRVVEAFNFPSDRLRAVEIMAPRVVDRRNAYSLYSAFDFDSEREQARAIFDRLK